MSDRDTGWRSWARAGVITFVLAVHSCVAMPSPHALDEDDLKSPEGMEEIQRWVGLLDSIGLHRTPEELSRETAYWSTLFSDLHNGMVRPFRPFLRFTGTGQAWALFASPDTYPHRLEIYIADGRSWIPVYRRNDPELDFLDGALRFRRVRGLYDGSTERQRVPYWNFSRWVAKKAFEAYPEAERVRIQMVQLHTTLPWEADDPEEIVRVKRVFKRSAILPEDGLIP